MHQIEIRITALGYFILVKLTNIAGCMTEPYKHVAEWYKHMTEPHKYTPESYKHDVVL